VRRKPCFWNPRDENSYNNPTRPGPVAQQILLNKAWLSIDRVLGKVTNGTKRTAKSFLNKQLV